MMKYTIVCPILNEEKHVGTFLDSILSQDVLPYQVIFVDDGCTDGSLNVIKKYTKRFSRILLTQKNYKSKYDSGSKIAEAFLRGYQFVDEDSTLVVKLDADLVFPTNYFSAIIEFFVMDQRLGLCGGVCVLDENKVERVSNLDHVRGALKCYRKQALDEIGNIIPMNGWDSLDEYMLMFHGWNIKVVEKLRVLHQRKTDTNSGFVKAFVKTGDAYHKLGYNFLITFTSLLKLSLKKPIFIGALIALFSFLKSSLTSKSPVPKEVKKFINNYRYIQILKKIKNLK